MSTRASWAPALWIGFVLAWATLALCRADRSEDAGGFIAETRPPLSYLATLLTVPLRLTGMADLRGYALPVGLAVLLALGFSPFRMRDALLRSFAALAAAAILIALVSTFRHGSWDLSRGWVFHLTVGCAWALLLGATVPRAALERILLAALVVAALAAAFSFWHRHILGLRYFLWPVGPVTTVAALGAVWAAMALACLVVLARVGERAETGKRHVFQYAGVWMPLAVVNVVISSAMVVIAGRRGAMLGLAAACAYVIGLTLWHRYRGRGVRGGMIAALLLAAAIGGGWVVRQSRDPDRVVSGPLAVRFAYWSHIVDRLRTDWPLGVGPDLFVCEMTTAAARRRAEQPHVMHGAFDSTAHNEWLQAFYELGVFGGAAYLALPLLAIAATARRWPSAASARLRMALLCGSAGLVAIVVTEASSVNLRHAMLPAWYWTLLGVTLAAARRDDSTPPPADAPRWWPRPEVRRFARIAAGVALLLMVADDLQRGVAHGEARRLTGIDNEQAAVLLAKADARMGAERWLNHRFDLGTAELQWGDAVSAVATWRALVERCAAYPGAMGRLAEALLLAGERTEAERVLSRYLSEMNPYGESENLLYAEVFAASPADRLTCARRALRTSAVSTRMEQTLAACWTDDEVVASLVTMAADAERDVVERPEPAWRDPLSPETLRLEAERRRTAGDIADAARLQRLAAETYGRLERENHPHRRAAEAETDAYFRAARYVFEADPAAVEEAYRLIREAERYAVLGIEHQELRRRGASAEFVGGVVAPTALPDGLRPMWRLSAKLRMAAGRDGYLLLRLLSALPAAERTAHGVAAEEARLVRELVTEFERIPAEHRPPTYPRLRELAGPPERDTP
jgi:hypothetical protein